MLLKIIFIKILLLTISNAESVCDVESDKFNKQKFVINCGAELEVSLDLTNATNTAIFHCLVEITKMNVYGLLPTLNNNNNVNHIQKLIIKGCKLPESFSIIKTNFPAVSELILQNEFEKVPDNFFSETSNLTRIELNFNQLFVINDSTFSRLTNLERIIIKENLISVLKPSHLENNQNLVNFTIISNQEVLTLEPNLFANKPRLNSVVLKANNIEELPDSLFSNSTNIKTINLSGNLLKSIKW